MFARTMPEFLHNNIVTLSEKYFSRIGGHVPSTLPSPTPRWTLTITTENLTGGSWCSSGSSIPSSWSSFWNTITVEYYLALQLSSPYCLQKLVKTVRTTRRIEKARRSYVYDKHYTCKSVIMSKFRWHLFERKRCWQGCQIFLKSWCQALAKSSPTVERRELRRLYFSTSILTQPDVACRTSASAIFTPRALRS